MIYLFVINEEFFITEFNRNYKGIKFIIYLKSELITINLVCKVLKMEITGPKCLDYFFLPLHCYFNPNKPPAATTIIIIIIHLLHVPTNRVGFPFLFFFPLFQCCLRLIYLSLFSAFVAIILTRTLIRFRFLYLTKLLILHTDYFYVGLLSLRLFSVYSSFCTFVTFFKII
jgi:hypothetical protein